MQPMKLKDYIKDKGLTTRKVAKELGISRGYLFELMAERTLAGRVTALRIVEWSDGMVKLQDLWE